MIQLDVVAANTITVASHRVAATWPWYVIRAAGFTAAGLLFLLMLSGIGQVTGLTYRVMEPVKAWVVHKALAIALCVAIAIHGGFLLIDHFVHFSLLQILVPFTSNYSNKTHLLGINLDPIAVTLGVLAMYGVAITVISSLVWMDKKKKTWKTLHYINYAVVLLVFLHALSTGSDLQYGVFRAVWIFIGCIVLIGIVMRLRRAGSLRRSGAAGGQSSISR